MTRNHFGWGGFGAAVLLGASVLGQEEPQASALKRPGAVSMDSFELIFERNIFDPNRRGPQPEREFTPPPAPDPIYTLKYFGLMRYGQRELAFFGGDGARDTGAKAPGEKVDEFELVELTEDVVRLRREGDDALIEVPVGGGFRKQGDAPWEFVEMLAGSGSGGSRSSGSRFASARDSRSDRGGETSGSESSSASDSGASSSGDDDARAALLRAMMERRRSE